ncbi:hypothetical protein [Chthoniobacter flavus]|uniref:hypothetical protein n=1 Tax=Chthoniobacter flavus TaxID=191863 RepID=UPI0005B269CD|nr:hypothetical protein [Chthoniobacter flavus]
MVAFVLFTLPAFAAKPAPEDDAKVVGNWQVSGPGFNRVYEISPGHTVRILGGTRKEKDSHMQPADDGSYRMIVKGTAMEKIVYLPATDQLHIEYYNSKQDLDLGNAVWKSTGNRVAQK